MSPSDALKLPAELRPVFEQDYPRFSDAEYSRRRDLLAGVMEAAGVDHLLIVSALNVGNATRWVTGWPGTNQALLLFRPGEKMVMYVEYHNHVPQARLIARDVDVRWGEDKGIATVIDELGRRGGKRVGVMGPLFGPRWKALEAKFQVVSLDGEYTRLRINNKSEEEIAWLRVGAALSDAGMAALVGGTKPGMTEHEIGNMIERAYVGVGGTNVIHFLGTTQMAAPDVCVPRQFTSRRKVQAGDFVFCELSAAWWDYSGQVLRGFTVEAEPTSLYRDLHATAFEAFNSITKAIRPGVHVQELIDASGDHREERLHHQRRSRSRLWRRLLCADPRLQEPPGRASGDDDAAGEHVHGGAAQPRHQGREGRRAVRRAGAGDQDRIRIAASHAARAVQGRADDLTTAEGSADGRRLRRSRLGQRNSAARRIELRNNKG